MGSVNCILNSSLFVLWFGKVMAFSPYVTPSLPPSPLGFCGGEPWKPAADELERKAVGRPVGSVGTPGVRGCPGEWNGVQPPQEPQGRAPGSVSAGVLRLCTWSREGLGSGHGDPPALPTSGKRSFLKRRRSFPDCCDSGGWAWFLEVKGQWFDLVGAHAWVFWIWSLVGERMRGS